ncbi:hypothetical protein KUTeg_016209 [Tegillarca granosa]|uniref:Uncharacterized protein n=1 Tax=Tegillarca granosa TaxID=220873 RepID=A0ABQ9EK68_TEGGR|nr:hypothetical protein KUTeg_016209 [Tegillarca granosa]
MRKIWIGQGKPRSFQSEAYANGKKAKDQFRNVQKKASENYMEQVYKDIDQAAECDIHLFWRLINSKKPRSSRIYPEITYKGKIHTDPKDIVDCFADYFEDMYRVRDNPNFDTQFQSHVSKSVETILSEDKSFHFTPPGGRILVLVVCEVFKQLKRRKAPGVDIQNEHLLYAMESGIGISECNLLTALNLYKQVLITYTLYGCEVWLNLKLSDVDHLNEFQHFVLKHLTCLPKTTRSDSVESVCDLLPLSVEVYRRKTYIFR